MSQAAAILSSILILLILTVGTSWEYKNRSPIAIFHFALLAIFAVPSLLLSFNPENHSFETISTANIFAVIYSSIFIVTRLVFRGTSTTRDRLYIPPSWELACFPLFLALAIFCFIYGLKIYSIQTALQLTWWDFVDSGNKIVVLGTYLAYCAAPILIVHQITKDKHKALKYLTIWLSFAFLLFAILILKTRSYLLIVLAPALLYYSYKANTKQKLYAIAFGLTLIFLFVLTRAVRHASDLNEFLSLGLTYYLSGASEGAETTFLDAFHFFISENNTFAGFNENYTLYRVLFFWTPSSWDLKPPEFSYVMHAAYYGSNLGGTLSMHPTVYGDAYGNAGMYGSVIYPIFLALFFSLVEFSAKLNRNDAYKLFVFAILTVNSLTFARGAIYNAFMFTAIPIALVLVTTTATSFFIRAKLP